jgi:hypothetical protein
VDPSAAVRCGLAASASRRLTVAALAEMRRQPGSLRGSPLPTNLLRHSDEQTIAGLAAVVAAVEGWRLSDDFTDWGVVAATRFVGRPSVTHIISRFLTEGAWGVSPHVIPHRSPHSVPGTLSQALALHGPNFAAGGGAGGEVEALLAAVALLHGAFLPGVWLVMSRLTPESDCDVTTGKPAADVEAHAVALALTRSPFPRTLELVVARERTEKARSSLAGSLSLSDLDEALVRFDAGADVEHPLGCEGRLLLRHGTPAERTEKARSSLAGPHAALFAARRAVAHGESDTSHVESENERQ